MNSNSGPTWKKTLTTPALLVLLIVSRLIWAGIFSWVTPLWEHYDEINHYQAARYHAGIINERPDADFPPEYQIYSQVTQPPLYHWLVGTALKAVDNGESIPLTGSPEPFCDLPQSDHFYIHDLENETPLNKIYQGIWLARAITIVVGAISVGVLWAAARTLWPYYPARAWLAAALFATFSPAAELSSWFNNDAPLMLIGALILWMLAHWLRHGIKLFTTIMIVILIIIGISTKMNVLAVLPAVALAALLVFRRIRKQGLTIIVHNKIAVGALLLLVSAPLLVSIGLCAQGFCRTHRPLSIDYLKLLSQDFVGTYMTQALGHFANTLAAPTSNPAYPPAAWTVLLTPLVLTTGIVYAMLRSWEERSERDSTFLLAAIILGALGLALGRVWWLKVPYMPARYFAVAFPAIMAFTATGFHLLSARIHRLFMLLPIVIYILVGISAINSSYLPLWRYPVQIKQLPEDIRSIDLLYENGLRVGGYTISGNVISLYLQAERSIPEPVVIEITLIDTDGQPAAHCEMLAGNALLPASRWSQSEWIVQKVDFDDIDLFTRGQSLRVRVTYLRNDLYLDNVPDYSREVKPVVGRPFLVLGV